MWRRLVHMRDMNQSYIWHMCDMTDSHAWHDPHIYMRHGTYFRASHDVFICLRRHFHVCAMFPMTRLHVTKYIHVCSMTRSHVMRRIHTCGKPNACVTWLVWTCHSWNVDYIQFTYELVKFDITYVYNILERDRKREGEKRETTQKCVCVFVCACRMVCVCVCAGVWERMCACMCACACASFWESTCVRVCVCEGVCVLERERWQPEMMADAKFKRVLQVLVLSLCIYGCIYVYAYMYMYIYIEICRIYI